jgi:hypothetical protein
MDDNYSSNGNDDEFSRFLGQGSKGALGLDGDGSAIVASTAIPLKMYFDLGKTQEVFFTSSMMGLDNDIDTKPTSAINNNCSNNDNNSMDAVIVDLDLDLEGLIPTSEFESYTSFARFSNRSHKNIVMF